MLDPCWTYPVHKCSQKISRHLRCKRICCVFEGCCIAISSANMCAQRPQSINWGFWAHGDHLCLYVYLSVYLPIHLSTIYLAIGCYAMLSVCLSVCLSIRPSVCLSILYLSLSLSHCHVCLPVMHGMSWRGMASHGITCTYLR